MRSENKIVLYMVVLIVCLSSFSGCILNNLVFGPSFSLISWNVCDNEGFPSLSLNFSSTDTCTIEILGYDGELIDSDLVFYGSDNVLLRVRITMTRASKPKKGTRSSLMGCRTRVTL